jgi:hypothetical protein
VANAKANDDRNLPPKPNAGNGENARSWRGNQTATPHKKRTAKPNAYKEKATGTKATSPKKQQKPNPEQNANS